MIDLIANVLLSFWLIIGALSYLWVLLYWLSSEDAQKRYGPGTPLVATILIPMWPVVFLLIWADERTDYD